MQCVLLVFLVLGCVCATTKLPKYIQPCSTKDPDFNQCVLTHGRLAIPFIMKGDRDIELPVLDPLFIPEIVTNDFIGKIKLINYTLTGLTDGVLQSVRTDVQNKSIEFEYMVAKLKIAGGVDLDARIASLHFKQTGEFEVTMWETRMAGEVRFNLTQGTDGRVYGTPTFYDMDMMPNDMKILVIRAFNGNPLLIRWANTFANENWRVIMEDAGKSMAMGLAAALTEMLARAANKVAIDDVFSD